MEREGVLRYIRGLHKDASEIDQPQGTLRFARNAMSSRTSNAVSNEGGITVVDILPPDSIVIGKVTITDGTMILFLKRALRSEIGMFKDNVYSTIYNPVVQTNDGWDMNFQETHPIEARFKLQGDGDLMVYWTDDLNPPRAMNITRQLESTVLDLYGKNASTSPDTKFIDRLNLFPHAGPVPHISLLDVFMGGGVRTGVYYLATGYVDADLTETNYVSLSNPVSIVDEVEGVDPIESYDGAPPGILTGKSITWTVSNLNTDVKYLSVAIIMRNGGVDTAVKLNDIEINNRTSFTVTFTGEEGYTTYSPEEIVIDNVEYRTAKTLEQLDNVLYVGNLTSNIDLGYQRFANFIKTESRTKLFPNFDPFIPSNDNLEKKSGGSNHISDGYRDVKNIYDYKGYMREEVYALYIAFILKSGQMSYAYHIPGREALQNVLVSNINEEVPLLPGLNPTSTFVNENDQSYGGNAEDWDIISLTGENSPQGRLFQWYDFSHLHSSSMNYWHNLHELYPNTDDFTIYDAQNPTVQAGDLRQLNVRHHRFPSNRNASRTTVISSNANDLNITQRTKAVIRWYWMGGVEGGSNPVIHGAQSIQDFNAARAYQAGFNPNNDGMGGQGPGHTDLTGAQDPGPNSCLPTNNTFFNLVNIDTVSDCTISRMDDIEFRYDTNIPFGANVVVGWDYPWGPDGGDFSIPLWNHPHCSEYGYGTVSAINGTTISISSNGGNWPQLIWEKRPGWVAWVECEQELTETEPVTHAVQALGFKLDDLKIPKSIADQIQGFRIYRADRTHENRTVLGQAPIHSMASRVDMDISGCDGGGINTGLIDYWLPGGQPLPVRPNWVREIWKFHDFYLLNRTPSLSSATHIKLQYILGMFNFKGPTRYYYDAQNTDTTLSPAIYSCWKPQVITSFHMSGNHYRIQGSNQRLNYLLKDKAKAYILGNTIYEGASDGFEKAIYNIGGETHIALRPKRFLPFLVSADNASWRAQRSDHSGPSFVSYTDNSYEPDADKEGLQLYLVNLKAFKTDVYNTMDVQNLVWTGYEVLGSDIDRFVVDEDGNPISSLPNRFETDDIYGGDVFICRYGYRMSHREEVNNVPNTYPNGGSVDHKSVIFTIVESTENINFRHMENLNVPYFPGAPLSDVLKVKADVDLTYNPDTETGNMKYNEDYSSVNDLKKVLPLPYQLVQPTSFSTRVIRSGKTTSSSLIDNFRIFEADQVRELNNNKGELWKITAMNSLLLFHMENTLYQTKGKQKMQTSEGSEAYIGQGDIFEQEPDELRQTDGGYMGTRSQWAATVTPYGYFSVDNLNRRIFFIGQGVHDLTSEKYGMEDWFRANIPSSLSLYGYDEHTDNPIADLGFHAVWDERYSRILLTKKDLKVTSRFIEQWKGNYASIADGTMANAEGIFWAEGNYHYFTGGAWTILIPEAPTTVGSRLSLFESIGWTISFAVSPSQDGRIGSWESVHDYIPYQYGYVGIDVHSFTKSTDSTIQRGIYKHNDDANMSRFYGTLFPFEVEMIHNESNGIDKLYASFEILLDVYDYDSSTLRYKKDLNAGFTSFILYNSDANSGETPIEYLINIRKRGSSWKINKFRDMSAEIVNGTAYYTGPFTQSNYGIVGVNVAGSNNAGTTVSTSLDMFNVEGMYEPLNTLYIDPNKAWNTKKKFIDRFLGIRLISDNTGNKLINLYNTTTLYREYAP